jgi:hypothetical protein
MVERIIPIEVAEAVQRSTETDPASFAETVVWLVRRNNKR